MVFSSHAVLRFVNDLPGVWVVRIPILFCSHRVGSYILFLPPAPLPYCVRSTTLPWDTFLCNTQFFFLSWHLSQACSLVNSACGAWHLIIIISLHLTKGFLGAIVARPNAIAQMKIPSSVADLCAARPANQSVNMIKPGRKRRGSFVSLDES